MTRHRGPLRIARPPRPRCGWCELKGRFPVHESRELGRVPLCSRCVAEATRRGWLTDDMVTKHDIARGLTGARGASDHA